MGLKIRRNEDLDTMFSKFAKENPKDPNRAKFLNHKNKEDQRESKKNKILDQDKTK